MPTNRGRRDRSLELTPVARKWLLAESPECLTDKLRLQRLEWDWMGRSEEYVRTGTPLELHAMTEGETWDAYQRGMRAMAGAFAGEAVRRLPVPSGARDLLDIGGSHGHYSAALCRRHEGLRAVVLDLPPAVEAAAPLLEAEGMGDRVVHRAGDALRDDLGDEDWDVVMIVQLVHHFSDEQNRELAARVARALRPGGVYARRGRAGGRDARVLLRPDQPVGHVDAGGDGGLAAVGRPGAEAADPLSHDTRRRDPGRGQALAISRACAAIRSRSRVNARRSARRSVSSGWRRIAEGCTVADANGATSESIGRPRAWVSLNPLPRVSIVSMAF